MLNIYATQFKGNSIAGDSTVGLGFDIDIMSATITVWDICPPRFVGETVQGNALDARIRGGGESPGAETAASLEY